MKAHACNLYLMRSVMGSQNRLLLFFAGGVKTDMTGAMRMNLAAVQSIDTQPGNTKYWVNTGPVALRAGYLGSVFLILVQHRPKTGSQCMARACSRLAGLSSASVPDLGQTSAQDFPPILAQKQAQHWSNIAVKLEPAYF